MPKLPSNKEPQLLGLKFQKRKRLVLILFRLGDLFTIFLGFLGLLELL
jgi:hypothetical protein